MPKRLFVQEAASLPKVKSADGTYRVCIIDEGEGSSGSYQRELFRASEALKFTGLPSFLNHPMDPAKPHLRPVESIAGRLVGDVALEEHDGKFGFWTDFKPRKEYADFVEEFADVIGVSIYMSAEGETLDDGRLLVESFVKDAYSSVDIVVAAGRGGRFKRAEESLRAIDTSLGIPEGTKPTAEASAGEKEEERMDEKDITAIAAATAAAITESLKPVLDFVTESAASKADKDQTEATAEALDTARAEGAKAAAESLTAIDAAGLPQKIAEGFKAQVLKGADVTEKVAEAKEIATAVAESADDAGDKPGTVVIESARKPGTAKGFALKGGRR